MIAKWSFEIKLRSPRRPLGNSAEMEEQVYLGLAWKGSSCLGCGRGCLGGLIYRKECCSLFVLDTAVRDVQDRYQND